MTVLRVTEINAFSSASQRTPPPQAAVEAYSYVLLIHTIPTHNFLNALFPMLIEYLSIKFFIPMPPHVLMNFRGFPPGCGDSVADF